MTIASLPLSLAACTLLLSASALAQTAPQQPTPDDKGTYSLSLTSQIVVLDVVVTDKQGNIVKGLTKDDFLVTEDKLPQTVRTLDAPGTEAPAVAPQINSTAELDKLEPRAPVSIIVLGEGNTSFNDQAYARYSLKLYLQSQGDTLTQPVMLVAADARHFMVLHDYTTSKQEILNALDHHFANPPWAPLSGQIGQQLAATLLTLTTVAQATAGHPGHKNMIWIGNNRAGAFTAAMDPERAAAVQKAFVTCTNLLRDSRVTLYTIDPGGTGSDNVNQNSGFSEYDPFSGRVSFNTIATATGGHIFKNHNDIDNMIGTSLRDGISFYTLTYVPAVARGDASPFREIKIKMKNPDLTATTRQGYFAAAPALGGVTNTKGKLESRLVMDVNTASRGVMVFDGIPLDIRRDATSPDKFILHMVVPNNAPQVDAAGKPVPDLSLIVQTYDRKGKSLARDARFVTLHSSGASADQTRAIDYPVTVKTASPAARIRVVVRDNQTGKIGADNVFLVDRKTLDDASIGLNPEKTKN